MTLEKNASAIQTRKKPIVMAELTSEERDAVIRENPLYAKIICRCESISEGEIIDCIHRNCGARSVKGVKKRVRPAKFMTFLHSRYKKYCAKSQEYARVWFYDMKADGRMLDDKRQEIEENDIPDIIERRYQDVRI